MNNRKNTKKDERSLDEMLRVMIDHNKNVEKNPHPFFKPKKASSSTTAKNDPHNDADLAAEQDESSSLDLT
jgi:hypothetical protein